MPPIIFFRQSPIPGDSAEPPRRAALWMDDWDALGVVTPLPITRCQVWRTVHARTGSGDVKSHRPELPLHGLTPGVYGAIGLRRAVLCIWHSSPTEADGKRARNENLLQ